MMSLNIGLINRELSLVAKELRILFKKDSKRIVYFNFNTELNFKLDFKVFDINKDEVIPEGITDFIMCGVVSSGVIEQFRTTITIHNKIYEFPWKGVHRYWILDKADDYMLKWIRTSSIVKGYELRKMLFPNTEVKYFTLMQFKKEV